METLEELQQQLVKLRSARAMGARSIEFTSGNGVGRKLEYRSDSELAAAIADLERRIAALQGTRVRTVMISTSKGL